MISVILTTYERRAPLSAALTSVFAQTVTELEVIVVDDGSTDGTPEWLEGQPLSLIRIAHSGNPAVARNAGLARAHGDLIALLDSDDAWRPTALEQLEAALSRHPEAGFSYCRYEPASSPMPSVPTSGDIFDSLLWSDFLVTGGVLLRRAAALAVGDFDAHCSPAEDWDYWLRLAARFPGAYVDNALISIGSLDDSLSRAPGGAIYRANLRVMRKTLAWCLANRPGSTSLARRSLRRHLLAHARYHWQRRAFAPVLRDLVRAPIGR